MPDQQTRPLALITGASAGIGAEFARQLAAGGWDLALTARRDQRLRALANELEAAHACRCLVVAADLADPAAPAAIMREIEAAGRQVDLLVNNAGYGVPGFLNAADWGTHARFLQVMVSAVAELTWHVLPGMQARGRGAIINVASLAALVPGSSGHTLYAAAKAFMVRFSESLAMENHHTGVTVQALCPGFTYSEFHDVIGNRDIVSQMPDYMWLQAEDVVRASLNALQRRKPPVIVVPGRFNRFISMLSRKLPYPLSFEMVRKRAGRFRKQD